ncbi:MAG TPA: SRPBCC family protein, partial [Myxococcales bacterium]|nr:SRPBCC family protein [Myxococcales bacterium]
VLPVRHEVSRSARVRGTPGEVYRLLRNVAQGPSWRSGLIRVEVLGNAAGRERFREIGKDGTILYEIEEDDPPRRLVTRIADESLPFGGSWTYELSPCPDGTELRITERGEVRNPIFRALSRFVFGHTANLDRYLADVERKQAGIS